MTNVLLLNGPPRSGKDTIGFALKQLYPEQITLHKFADPIYDMVCGLTGISRDRIEAFKDDELPILNHMTPRQWMIKYSEQFIKPELGRDIWGHSLAQRMLNDPADNGVHIVTDLGFTEEVGPIVDAFGWSRIQLVHLHRNGCTFDNDSRYAVFVPQLSTYEMHNDADIAHIVSQVYNAIEKWIE